MPDKSLEVAEALASGKPVVALESTIISHGMPYPKNVETAAAVEDIVREAGAIPATIAILGGRLKVGLSADEIQHLGKQGTNVIKCSRRDLPFVTARKEDGATTVAATMIIAAMAGIRVFATGGIGGVHRGVQETMDISADLEELARTSVAVVCAGIKSVLDIGRTLEYLETKGVPVVGFGTDTLPAFYTRDSGFGVDYRIDDPLAAATAMKSKWDLQLQGGMVITNPIPEQHALDPDRVIGSKCHASDDAVPVCLGLIGDLMTAAFAWPGFVIHTDGQCVFPRFDFSGKIVNLLTAEAVMATDQLIVDPHRC